MKTFFLSFTTTLLLVGCDRTSTGSSKETEETADIQSDSVNTHNKSNNNVFHLDLNSPKISANKVLGVEVSTERHFKVDNELHNYLPVAVKNISQKVIIGATLKLNESLGFEREIGKFELRLQPGHTYVLRIPSKQFKVTDAVILNKEPFFGSVEASNVFYADGSTASEKTTVIIK